MLLVWSSSFWLYWLCDRRYGKADWFLWKVHKSRCKKTAAASKMTYSLSMYFFFFISNQFATVKPFFQLCSIYSRINVCCMNVIRTYCICHAAIIMWAIAPVVLPSLLFITPIPWPHGILKCPLDVLYRIWPFKIDR